MRLGIWEDGAMLPTGGNYGHLTLKKDLIKMKNGR
jgi:hypothetical protein